MASRQTSCNPTSPPAWCAYTDALLKKVLRHIRRRTRGAGVTWRCRRSSRGGGRCDTSPPEALGTGCVICVMDGASVGNTWPATTSDANLLKIPLQQAASRPYADTSYRCLESPPKRSLLHIGPIHSKTGFDRTDSYVLAHLSKLHKLLFLATTRLYVPEILFSAEKTRQKMFHRSTIETPT